MSSTDVKTVTEAAQAVAEIGKRARATANTMRARVKEVQDALDMADVMNKALGGAAAELRGALGIKTNSPPTGGDDEEGDHQQEGEQPR